MSYGCSDWGLIMLVDVQILCFGRVGAGSFDFGRSVGFCMLFVSIVICYFVMVARGRFAYCLLGVCIWLNARCGFALGF